MAFCRALLAGSFSPTWGGTTGLAGGAGSGFTTTFGGASGLGTGLAFTFGGASGAGTGLGAGGFIAGFVSPTAGAVSHRGFSRPGNCRTVLPYMELRADFYVHS